MLAGFFIIQSVGTGRTRALQSTTVCHHFNDVECQDCITNTSTSSVACRSAFGHHSDPPSARCKAKSCRCGQGTACPGGPTSLLQRSCLSLSDYLPAGGLFKQLSQAVSAGHDLSASKQPTCICLMLPLLQSAVVFQAYGAACRAISGEDDTKVPLPYSQVCAAGDRLLYLRTSCVIALQWHLECILGQ